MTKLPVISGKKLLHVLKRDGYVILRQKGSHVFIESQNGYGTVIPVHGNEDLGRGLLRSILEDLKLDTEDLAQML